jgi:hypothetical protein
MQTGKPAWYYQTMHHEVWDVDLVSGPILFDVTVGGRNAAISFRVNPVGDTLKPSPTAIGHTAAMVGEAERGEKVGVPNTETVTAYNPDAGCLNRARTDVLIRVHQIIRGRRPLERRTS